MLHGWQSRRGDTNDRDVAGGGPEQAGGAVFDVRLRDDGDEFGECGGGDCAAVDAGAGGWWGGDADAYGEAYEEANSEAISEANSNADGRANSKANARACNRVSN